MKDKALDNLRKENKRLIKELQVEQKDEKKKNWIEKLLDIFVKY